MSREPSPELALVGPVIGSFPGVRFAMVFGSVARGAARPDSDLDVALAGDIPDVLELSARLSDVTGRAAHVVRLADASIPLLAELIDDAVVVYEKQPGAAAIWRSQTLADLELDRPWYQRQRDAWLKHVAEKGLP